MDITVFIVSIFILQVICLYIGRKASTGMQTQEDYFLAGRGLRFFPLFMTLIATQIGGGLVLGSAEEAYRHGWYIILYPLGAALGMLLLAAGIGKRLSQFKVSTVAQLFEVVYQSPRLKKVASLLSIISLFMILVGQVIASQKFMNSLGVGQEWVSLAFWGIVIVYTVMGGMKAVVATDIIQAFYFIGIFIVCFIYSVWMRPEAAANLLNSSWGDSAVLSQSKLCGWLLMPLLFMVIEQDMAQRCFAAKSGRTVSIASLASAITIVLVCGIPVFYGILAKSLGMEIPAGHSVLMTILQSTTTPVLTALFGCAVIAAILSTADALINAIGSNIAQDFQFRSDNVRASKWVSAGIGVVALCCSFYFDNIVDILIQSYELSVSCLFIPVTAALFIRQGYVYSALYAVILGAIGFVLFRIFPIEVMPKEIASLILSGIGYGIGELQARFVLPPRHIESQQEA